MPIKVSKVDDRVFLVSKKRPRKPAPPLESEIQKQCLEYLAMKRIPCGRANSGSMKGEYNGKKRFVRFSAFKGQSDITGILPPFGSRADDMAGRRLEIEVKRPGKEPTKEQADFIKMINQNGGVAFWVDSLEKLISKIEELGY